MKATNKEQAMLNLLASKTDARVDNLDWAKLSEETKHDEATQWIIDSEKYINYLVMQYRPDRIMATHDDLMQTAKLAAWKAFDKYDNNRVDVLISTYLWAVMSNAIKEVFRKTQAQKRQAENHAIYIEDMVKSYRYESSLEAEAINTALEDNGCTIGVMISAEDSVIDSVEEQEAVSYWRTKIDSLPRQLKEIMLLTLKGKKQIEIAAELGISQSSVSAKLKQSRAILAQYRTKRGA